MKNIIKNRKEINQFKVRLLLKSIVAIVFFVGGVIGVNYTSIITDSMGIFIAFIAFSTCFLAVFWAFISFVYYLSQFSNLYIKATPELLSIIMEIAKTNKEIENLRLNIIDKKIILTLDDYYSIINYIKTSEESNIENEFYTQFNAEENIQPIQLIQIKNINLNHKKESIITRE